MIYVVTLVHTYGLEKRQTEERVYEVEVTGESGLSVVEEALYQFHEEGYQLYETDTISIKSIQEVETEHERYLKNMFEALNDYKTTNTYVQQLIDSGISAIKEELGIEEEIENARESFFKGYKYDYFSIKNGFKFKHRDNDQTVYTATWNPHKQNFEITWNDLNKGITIYYSLEIAEQNIKNGIWKRLPNTKS